MYWFWVFLLYDYPLERCALIVPFANRQLTPQQYFSPSVSLAAARGISLMHGYAILQHIPDGEPSRKMGVLQ